MVDGNGVLLGRSSELGRKKKQRHFNTEAGSNSSARRDAINNDKDEDSDYGDHITEERYRSMLGEHIQKYRRVRFRESSSSLASPRMGMPLPKRNLISRGRKSGNEDRVLHGMETPSDHLREISPLKHGSYYDGDFTPEYGNDRFSSSFDSGYLDIGEGISYRIPPTYDTLAASLNLPSFSDIRVDEYYLKGTLDLASLTAMMASDRTLGRRSRGGMGEPQPQYESLQARLKVLSANNSVQNFNLQVSDTDLESSIPEGAAGGSQRSIMSEGGTLQVYYVKVLEKGDTYEIIKRKLPKKQIVKKDPASIEKEEMEKIGKVWVNIVRRDIPKHHRFFTNFHRKQLTDAKRCSETCQREVKMKVSRSLKLMRGAALRTRKLARDMLVFWKRVDKEQAEIRKREEREAAEAMKREEELREAKRQQQRLNFLLSQTELYSHFMQNKTTSQNSEALPVGDGEPNNQDSPLSSSNVEPGEDPEEAELRREALRAAQQAVSQQKKDN